MSKGFINGYDRFTHVTLINSVCVGGREQSGYSAYLVRIKLWVNIYMIITYVDDVCPLLLASLVTRRFSSPTLLMRTGSITRLTFDMCYITQTTWPGNEDIIIVDVLIEDISQ